MKLENLHHLHIEDLNNEKHPSVFFDYHHYKVLIYRLFEDNSDELIAKSFAFIINKENKIFQYFKDIKGFKELKDYEEFYTALDKIIDSSMSKVDKIIAQIEKLEEDIYDSKDNIQNWFDLKKDIIRVERVLNH